MNHWAASRNAIIGALRSHAVPWVTGRRPSGRARPFAIACVRMSWRTITEGAVDVAQPLIVPRREADDWPARRG